MIVKLLTEHLLEFLSLKGVCRGSSESKHVKMPNCWKSHALTHYLFVELYWSLANLRNVAFHWQTRGFMQLASGFM